MRLGSERKALIFGGFGHFSSDFRPIWRKARQYGARPADWPRQGATRALPGRDGERAGDSMPGESNRAQR